MALRMAPHKAAEGEAAAELVEARRPAALDQMRAPIAVHMGGKAIRLQVARVALAEVVVAQTGMTALMAQNGVRPAVVAAVAAVLAEPAWRQTAAALDSAVTTALALAAAAAMTIPVPDQAEALETVRTALS
jgi:hypothetical protein